MTYVPRGSGVRGLPKNYAFRSTRWIRAPLPQTPLDDPRAGVGAAAVCVPTTATGPDSVSPGFTWGAAPGRQKTEFQWRNPRPCEKDGCDHLCFRGAGLVRRGLARF